MLIAGVVLIAGAAVGAIINGKRSTNVLNRAERAEKERDDGRNSIAALTQVNRNVYRSLLYQVSHTLGLTNSERVSLYVHDAGGLASFQLIGRHSLDQGLEDAPGRSAYPDNQGIIGKAWHQGWAEETALPDPDVRGSGYVAENFKRYQLPTEVTEDLAMKSRVLAAARYPSNAVGGKYIGVLVLESLDGTWDITDLKSRLEGNEWWYTLQEHLHAQRPHLPALSKAFEAGF